MTKVAGETGAGVAHGGLSGLGRSREREGSGGGGVQAGREVSLAGELGEVM